MSDILCENNRLSLLQKAGPDNAYSSYWWKLKDEVRTDLTHQSLLNKRLSYIIFGFKYIYEDYKKYVLPIEFISSSDVISLGTCFLYKGGIATARHCVEGAKEIAIQGISKMNWAWQSLKSTKTNEWIYYI
jgi:hypothetical protein